MDLKYYISDPVQKVALASSNLERSKNYWEGLAGMTVYESDSSSICLGYADNQVKLVIKSIGKNFSSLIVWIK